MSPTQGLELMLERACSIAMQADEQGVIIVAERGADTVAGHGRTLVDAVEMVLAGTQRWLVDDAERQAADELGDRMLRIVRTRQLEIVR